MLLINICFNHRSLYGCHNNAVLVPMTDPRCFVHQLAASFAPNLILGAEHSKHFRPLSEEFPFLLQESGYMHIQATKPDTVGEKIRERVNCKIRKGLNFSVFRRHQHCGSNKKLLIQLIIKNRETACMQVVKN